MSVDFAYLCLGCKHYQRGRTPESCAAYPSGIPDVILAGYDHRNAYPGDGAIRFEVIPGFEDVVTAYESRNDDIPVPLLSKISRPDAPAGGRGGRKSSVGGSGSARGDVSGGTPNPGGQDQGTA